MKSSRRIAVAVAVNVLATAAVLAAGIDFKDPRRALGREDDIRVDAQLLQETISAGSPISVTYQIENLTSSPIAIADKVTDASYDPDSQIITISVGAEIPQGVAMPHLTVIPPAEKRTFRTGVAPQFVVANAHSPWARVPRLVQITVNILRDVRPFASLIAQQRTSAPPPMLPNDLLDQWASSVSSVELNSLPVRWSDAKPLVSAETGRPPRGRGF
jgi:hypothetical protein